MSNPKSPRIARALASGRLLLLLLLIGACTVERTPDSSRAESAADLPAVNGDSLRIELQFPVEVRAGTDVPIELRVQNVTERGLELSLQGREIVFDVTVSRVGGPVVWRRLEGLTVQSILQLKPLAPGEVLTLRATWRQQGANLPSGEYEATATIPTDGAPLRPAPVRFRITS